MRRIAFFIIITLSACSANPPARHDTAQGTVPPAASAPTAPPPVASLPAASAPLPLPRPAQRPASASGKTASDGKSAPARENNNQPAPATIDLAALEGADLVSIEAIVGPADDVRVQSSGLVWAYNDPSCSVEFYLFPEVSTADFSVLGHKILPAELSESERAACLERLASRKRTP